jgi:hypothetical protein
MSGSVRIGNACGFWGDRLDAAAEMLTLEPDLDFLTLDFLAEVSMSILALQRSRDPEAGWPQDVVQVVRSIAPYWQNGGRCRIITNAGGLNPLGCARACLEALQQAGCTGRTVAAVSGDDVLALLQSPQADGEGLRNLDTGRPIAEVRQRLMTANAYLGAQPIVEALARGADLVIAGRVADPSLTVAACVYRFAWPEDDWDRLAGATVAGHLIECGTQVTGGIATDWLRVPEVNRCGFPVAEVAEDGSCLITKPRGTGGRVCGDSVKEQLLYEIADPDNYLSPDVTVSFLALAVEDQGDDRVRVSGAQGRPASPTYKVGATWQDGFRAQGQLTIYGADAVAKARRAGEAVLQRLNRDGVCLRESLVECLGAGACRPQGADPAVSSELRETVLRIAVADDSREAVERFACEIMPLVTAGPQGTTGYAEGRPRVHPLFRFWPCLIGRDRIKPQVEILAAGGSATTRDGRMRDERTRDEGMSATGSASAFVGSTQSTGQAGGTRSRPAGGPDSSALGVPSATKGDVARRLGDIALARSGDKGIHANVGLLARRPEDFARLCREVTSQRVAAYFGLADAGRVTRYVLPNLAAINLVLHGILADPLRTDAQGKALGQVLLDMPLGLPESLTF